jgi:hypothetical protein
MRCPASWTSLVLEALAFGDSKDWAIALENPPTLAGLAMMREFLDVIIVLH